MVDSSDGLNEISDFLFNGNSKKQAWITYLSLVL